MRTRSEAPATDSKARPAPDLGALTRSRPPQAPSAGRRPKAHLGSGTFYPICKAHPKVICTERQAGRATSRPGPYSGQPWPLDCKCVLVSPPTRVQLHAAGVSPRFPAGARCRAPRGWTVCRTSGSLGLSLSRTFRKQPLGKEGQSKGVGGLRRPVTGEKTLVSAPHPTLPPLPHPRTPGPANRSPSSGWSQPQASSCPGGRERTASTSSQAPWLPPGALPPAYTHPLGSEGWRGSSPVMTSRRAGPPVGAARLPASPGVS